MQKRTCAILKIGDIRNYGYRRVKGNYDNSDNNIILNMDKIKRFLIQFAINFEEKLLKIDNSIECGFSIETNGRISKSPNPIQTVSGDYQVELYVGFPLVSNPDEFFRLMLREELNLPNPYCYYICVDGLFNETNAKICCFIDNLSNDSGFIKFTDTLIDLMRNT